MKTADEMYDESLRNTTIRMCRERGWHILLTCRTCGHGGGSHAMIGWLALTDYPPNMTMEQLAERATFSKCEHKGAWIDHRQDRSSGKSGYPFAAELKDKKASR